MGRVGNGGRTQRFACMWYVVTGLAPARIEGGPGNGPGDSMNPDLSLRCISEVTGKQLVYKMVERMNE